MGPSSPRLNLSPPVSRPAAPRPVTPRPPGASAASSPVKVLVAGVDKDTRAAIEAAVRGAFASRPADEPWTVSLVQLGGTWSVRLEGPRERGEPVSFMVDAARLVDRLRGAIEKGDAVPERSAPAAQPNAPQPRGPAGTSREAHTCEKCQQRYFVVYERLADEPVVRAAVACPHCWGLNFVEVGDWAAAGHDYRAEKA